MGGGVARHARRHPRRRRVPRRGRRRRRSASARIEAPEQGRAHIQLVHVRPRARRQGVAKALLRECVQDARDRGAARVSLDVLADERDAREVVAAARLRGARRCCMVAPVDALERAARARSRSASRGRRRTCRPTTSCRSSARSQQFVPRLEAPEVSSNGSWIRVVDPVLDRDREAHGAVRQASSPSGSARSRVALALEHGAVVRFRLYERGRMVDEYLSVPTFYGALPEGRRARARRQPDARRAAHRAPTATRCAASRARPRRRPTCRRRRSSTSRSPQLMGLEP